MTGIAKIVRYREVWRARSILIEGRTWEIPGQIPLIVCRYIRPFGCGNDSFTGTIHVLEEEAAILASVFVREIIQNITSFQYSPCRRMMGAFKIIGAAVKDHETAVDAIHLEAESGLSTNRLCKAKGEEANNSAYHQYDAD